MLHAWFACAIVATLLVIHAIALGDETCWMGEFQFETCCLPPPQGNPECWDPAYTYTRCCQNAQTGGLDQYVDIGSMEDLSALGGCELSMYQEFKANAAAWYKGHRLNLDLIREVSFLMSRFKGIYRSCAPAALTATLLKLEAIYFEDESVWNGLFSFYTEHHHEAVAAGALLQSHHANGWPLLEAVRKINALRATAYERVHHVAKLARATVDVVLCYCGKGERIDWLRGFGRLPWRDMDRTASTKAHVALRFYHKCGSDIQSEREAERRRLIAAWEDTFHTVTVQYVEDVIRADDCSAYLSYIVDRYDDLPDFAMFLHADAPEHIPSLELLMDTVYAASRGYLSSDIGFAHLAHNYVRHNYNCSKGLQCQSQDEFEFNHLWRNIFGSSIVPSMIDGDLNAYCCVQFLVRRNRIHLREKSFYARALSYFGETPDSHMALFPIGRFVWNSDVLGRTPCQLAMYIWHVLFGEDMQLPRRHHDTRLPLFMQMLNIEIEAVFEDEANLDGIGNAMMHIADRSKDTTYENLQMLFAGT